MNTWAASMALCTTELAIYSVLRGIPVCLANQQCSLITTARNTLVRNILTLEPQPTHLLFIDADMCFPKDGLLRLLAHDKPVVGAFYSKRVPPHDTVGCLMGNPDVSQGGIHRADVMPHGFVLIKREVYEYLKSPWYYESYDPAYVTLADPDGQIGEDTNFSRDCVKAGIEMWCDADLTFECAHIGEIHVPCLRPEPNPELV
jgi:hypothetical protein